MSKTNVIDAKKKQGFIPIDTGAGDTIKLRATEGLSIKYAQVRKYLNNEEYMEVERMLAETHELFCKLTHKEHLQLNKGLSLLRNEGRK